MFNQKWLEKIQAWSLFNKKWHLKYHCLNPKLGAFGMADAGENELSFLSQITDVLKR